jgi:hypothetical protein
MRKSRKVKRKNTMRLRNKQRGKRRTNKRRTKKRRTKKRRTKKYKQRGGVNCPCGSDLLFKDCRKTPQHKSYILAQQESLKREALLDTAKVELKRKTREIIRNIQKSNLQGLSTEIKVTGDKEFIEVPQGHIYSYNGGNVFDIESGKLIKSGSNIILYVYGLGPCRGLITKTEHLIYVGHLDSVEEQESPLVLETIKQSLPEEVIQIYYIIGHNTLDVTLMDTYHLSDVSVEVFGLIPEKNYDKVIIIENSDAWRSDTISGFPCVGYDMQTLKLVAFPITKDMALKIAAENRR